jgi:arylformamidase
MVDDPFRIRDYVPEFDDIVAEIRKRSAATRANLRMVEVAYAAEPGATLDLFFPTSPAPAAPVHMFVHGGYWRMFSKRDYSCVADTITEAGAIGAIVDYALMPAVRMEVLVKQVQRAKTWLLSNIAKHGGDPAELTISGHSAGAHLAAMCMTAPDTPSGVKAALLLGGLYDLKPLQHSFLKAEIAITDEEVARFTPLTQTYDRNVTVTLLVGADETPPFHSQAAAFEHHLKSQGLRSELHDLSEANHMSSVRDLGLIGTQAGSELAELIRAASSR